MGLSNLAEFCSAALCQAMRLYLYAVYAWISSEMHRRFFLKQRYTQTFLLHRADEMSRECSH